MATYDKGFLGNPKIRAAGSPIAWTLDTVAEFQRCAEDQEYFIRNYVYIKTVDSEELVKFEPRSYQLEMLDKMINNRFVIVKLPRQCGKTTLTAAVLLWHLIFMRNFSILVAAHKGDKARDVITNVKEMYEALPDFLQHGVDTWNKGSVKLETGSRIRGTGTSGSAARGDVYNMVYLDEFAFVAKHIAEEFVKSVMPTVTSGKSSKIFITSTPKGLNMFYDMWTAAVERKSTYQYVEIKWNDVPGRDEAFRQDIIAQFGQEYFDQEYGAEFIGSSRTLIAGWKLLELAHRIRTPAISTSTSRIFSEPDVGRHYAVTVDVSEGLGADYHSVMVFDITSLPYTVAAIYHDNTLDPLSLPGVVHEFATRYNEALVLVEANFGQQIGEILYSDLEYENVVFTSKGKSGPQARTEKISSGHSQRSRVGMQMNAQTKRIGCSNLKTLIEQDQLMVPDKSTYEELKRFVVMKKSYAGEDGHDDLVMCMVMFAWMVDQGYIRDATDVNVRGRIAELSAQRIEDEMQVLCFRTDGGEEEMVAIDLVRPAIDVPGENGEPHPWAKMFDKETARGGKTEVELHDSFMRDMFNL